MDERSLTIRDVSRHLRVSIKTVRRYIHSGRLMAVNVGASSGRKTWRISHADLVSFEIRNARFPGQLDAYRQKMLKSEDVIQFV